MALTLDGEGLSVVLGKERDPCGVTVFEASVVGHRHTGRMVPCSCSNTAFFLCFFVLVFIQAAFHNDSREKSQPPVSSPTYSHHFYFSLILPHAKAYIDFCI